MARPSKYPDGTGRCGWSRRSCRSTGRSGLRSRLWPTSSGSVPPETVRAWVRRAEVDAGKRPGVTTQEAEEFKRLKRENAELRRANEILKAAAMFFGAELDRPGRR